MNTFKQIVERFETACNATPAVHEFAYGTIDKLDSTTQNIQYSYMFLRPLASPGIVLSENGLSGTRTLSFELYSLDVPKLTESDYLQVMSTCEQNFYSILSYFNVGPYETDSFITLNTIVPVNEAFNDRVYGWVGTIDYTEVGVLDYCSFPNG